MRQLQRQRHQDDDDDGDVDIEHELRVGMVVRGAAGYLEQGRAHQAPLIPFS